MGIFKRYPDKPEDIFEDLVGDYKKVFRENLEGIYLFGSGARGDYFPGKSDLNFLILVKENALADLEKTFDVVKKWKKRRVSVPYILTKGFIEKSLDTYPIEFLEMKLHHVCVYGDDALEALKIEPYHVRLQLERELRGKIVLLRRGFLEVEGAERGLIHLFKISVPAFLTYFVSLLYLKNISVPKEREKLIAKVEEHFRLRGDVFSKCLRIKDGNYKLEKQSLLALFNDYVREIERFISIVDEIRV
ncbi:MAG: nucleotidyltransferase domain-containing protein [Syntrophales bacterium]|nr:nucleotidyltransferase domain-containing protein [Syntrophales bacterium]